MRTCVVVAALLVGSAAAADRPPNEAWHAATLYGRWEAAAVHCPGCSPPPAAAPGMLLSLGPTTAEATPAGHCAGQAGYRLMHPPAEQRRQLQHRLPSAWGKGTPRWVAVTCDGLDFLVLAQWPNGALAYLADGDDSYLLRRLPTAKGNR
jgi:hypothetical protein